VCNSHSRGDDTLTLDRETLAAPARRKDERSVAVNVLYGLLIVTVFMTALWWAFARVTFLVLPRCCRLSRSDLRQ